MHGRFFLIGCMITGVLWNLKAEPTCTLFDGTRWIFNQLSNGPIFSASESIQLEFRTVSRNAPLFFAGGNESFLQLDLLDGNLLFSLRIPAETESHSASPEVTTAVLSPGLQWHHPTRAGFLTLNKVFSPVPNFNVRLDDGQWHSVRVERNAKSISLEVDETILWSQQLHFDGIQAGLLNILEIDLGGPNTRQSTQKRSDASCLSQRCIRQQYPTSLKGQFLMAEFQVDDVNLDILQFAAKSKYGFLYTASDVATPSGVPCSSNILDSPPQQSVSFTGASNGDRDKYLHLRMPRPATRDSQEFSKAMLTTHTILLDVSIPPLESYEENQFLLLFYSTLPTTVFPPVDSFGPRASTSLVILELRAGQIWLTAVNGRYILNSTAVEVSRQYRSVPEKSGWRLQNITLEVWMKKYYMNESLALLITARQVCGNASSSSVSILAPVENAPFKIVSTDWVENMLKQDLSSDATAGPLTEQFPLGRNILLGGSNWTAEDAMGRLPPTVWSALGARHSFRGCVNRLTLNGQDVNFGPVLQSRLRTQSGNPEWVLNEKSSEHVHGIRLGCINQNVTCASTSCENGGICRVSWGRPKCDCMTTSYYGERCQIPQRVLTFAGKDIVRLRFPMVQLLESTQMEVDFRSKKQVGLLLTTKSNVFYSDWLLKEEDDTLPGRNGAAVSGVLDQILQIRLVRGHLQVVLKLDFKPIILDVPTYVSDDRWHRLRVVRSRALLRVTLDGIDHVRGLPRTKGRQGKNDAFDGGHRTEFVLIDLGGPVVHPADIEAQSFIMRIREVEMGSSRAKEQSEPSEGAPSLPTPFVGQMRRFVFNGIRPFEEDEGGGGRNYILEATASLSGGLKSLLPQNASPGGVGGRSSKHALSDLLSVVHPVTFKTADCFLVLPTLKLYDAFSLQFSINTRQTDGIILFNSAGETGDFLALELVQGNLALSFDMGHGVHQQTAGDVGISDGQWHHIRLYRTDVTDAFLTLSIEEESGPPRLFNITIPYRDRARNFNFYEPLYLGGIPVQNVARRREKMISKHGIQGCIGNFGINNNTEIDIFGLAESKFGSNKTTPDCQWQVVPGCFQRPATAPSCNQNKERGDYSSGSHDLPYCLNDGVCLQVWTSLHCACELTTFTGKRCHLPGTSLKFGETSDTRTDCFIQFTYLHARQNTNRDELALGIQLEPVAKTATLLYVDTSQESVDFLHLMVEEGYVNLTYNMGGGPISVKETRRKVDDGYYHRIRVFRNGYWMLLEVDDLRTRHVSTKPSGEQFNEQQSVWLGSHPGQNGSSALRGILTGVFYNGLLLNELAAGLSHRADIHVSRHPEIQYLANFKVKLARDSPLQILPPELLESDNATLAHHDESARPAVSPKAQSAWEVTDPSFSVSSTKWGGRQHDSPEHAPASTKATSRFPQPAAATSEPPQRPFSGHVNVWLVVSLAGAGLIFICSVTFLVYWWFGSQHRSYMTVPQSFSLVMPTSATTTTPSEIPEQSYASTRSNLPTSPAAAAATGAASSLSSPLAQPLRHISPGLPGTTGSATAVTLFSAPTGLAYVSFSDSSPLVPVSFCPAISLTAPDGPNEDPTPNSVQEPLQIAMTSSALTVRPTSLFVQQQLPVQQQREIDQTCWQEAAEERRVVEANDGTLVRIVHRQQTNMQPQKSDSDPV